MIDLMVKNAVVVTMDARRRVIRNGAIGIMGSSVYAVGEANDLVPKYPAATVIDAGGKLALPGLINTHMHAGYCLLKGIASDIPDRLSWLSAVYPYVEQAGPEECYNAALLACLEMIKGGTTFFVENNPFISNPRNTDAIAAAVEETGMRAAIGRMFSDINAPAFLLCDAGQMRSEMDRLYREWHNRANGRIQVWIYAPGPGIRESPERMADILKIARDYGIRITSHWAAGTETGSPSYYTERYGVERPTRFLLDRGYLGPGTLLVHVVSLDDGEIGMLAMTDTKVSHCPTASMIRASKPFHLSPVASMLKAGVTVGLGTDAGICNDTGSMFEAMKLAVLGQKVRMGNPAIFKAERALEMATLNGAKAVGMGTELGAIEANKRADMILVDARKPHIMPLHNVYENLVYCAHDSDVDTVIVNGRVIMEGRKVKTVNEDRVLESVTVMMERLDAQAAARAKYIAGEWEGPYRGRFQAPKPQ